MDTPASPLSFPDHYPPKTKWGEFFLGVRWIGPDLSFLRSWRDQQAARDPSLISLWGGGTRQEVVQVIGRRAKQSLRWKSEIFVPQDQFSAVIHGPTFGWGDDYPLMSLSDDLQDVFGVPIPRECWDLNGGATLGEVVDTLVAIIEGRTQPQIRSVRPV